MDSKEFFEDDQACVEVREVGRDRGKGSFVADASHQKFVIVKGDCVEIGVGELEVAVLALEHGEGVGEQGDPAAPGVWRSWGQVLENLGGLMSCDGVGENLELLCGREG